MSSCRMARPTDDPSPTPTAPQGGVGLFWRTYCLLAALILCATLGWLHLFRVQEYEPRILRNAHQIATLVNLTRSALIHTDAIARVALLKTLADEEDLRLLTREPDDNILPFGESTLENKLASTLTERLGPDTVVASSVNGETGLWVGFRIGNDAYWLLMDPNRLRPLSNRSWLVWLVIASALSLAGSAAIARLINRPLGRLLAAASLIREGRFRDIALDEKVSTPELRALNIGFNRMADRLANLDEERALMLAGISHDLRTPLSRLRLETELSVKDPESREAMVADIAQLDDIIDKFLGYARPEHNNLSAVLLGPIISKCITPLRHQERLKIQIDIAEDLQVLADPVELGRVISNLLENARRYGQSAQDGITHVDIDAYVYPDRVTVCVRDHGRGVPEEQLIQLTQPFFRGDAARTSASGSGLGLAIVERAMLRMGGSLSLFNHGGGGLMAVLELQPAR